MDSVQKWQPGDVGVNLAHGYRGIYVANCSTHNRPTCWHNESGLADNGDDIRRPLVVIDPESVEDKARLCTPRLREQMEAVLRRSIDDAEWTGIGFAIRAALREFANPTPRIEEPTGLGAVVEDTEGVRWVRIDDPPSTWAASMSNGDRCSDYAAITVVRVLSEGVAQ